MGDQFASFGLLDKVAVITGPSQGIGRTLAIGLAQAGTHLVLVSRNRPALDEVADEVKALGRQALVIPTDISDVSAVRNMAQQAQEAFGRIDLLVNNAAWTDTVPALEVTEEQWNRTLDVSLKGIFFACQAVGRYMVQQNSGKIINIGSTLGEVAFAGRSVYAAAKAGVHQLTRALALEWAPHGVYVNAVAPCITETPTRRQLMERPGYKEWATGQMLPIRRWAQPNDLLGAVLFLASPLSDMVVGHVLMVDGGWIIH